MSVGRWTPLLVCVLGLFALAMLASETGGNRVTDVAVSPEKLRVESIDNDANGIFEEYKVIFNGETVLHLRDGNQDGHLDEWVFYEGNRKKVLIADRSYDGKPDGYWLWTSERGGVTALDSDHDGQVDETAEFRTVVDWRTGD